LVVDPEQVEGIASDIAVLGHHDGDGLAHITDLASCQHRVFWDAYPFEFTRMARRDITDGVREVCSREHRYHPGEGASGCGIYG
jgi:hypothetical protein